MGRSSNVKVVLDATVIWFVTDTRGRVDHVVATSVRRDTLRVQAREFVLAAGGLENARLLFALREGEAASRIPGDVLGRYYMDHSNGDVVGIRCRRPRLQGVWDCKPVHGGQFGVSFWRKCESNANHLGAGAAPGATSETVAGMLIAGG